MPSRSHTTRMGYSVPRIPRIAVHPGPAAPCVPASRRSVDPVGVEAAKPIGWNQRCGDSGMRLRSSVGFPLDGGGAGEFGGEGVHEDFVAGFSQPEAGLAESAAWFEASVFVGPDSGGVVFEDFQPHHAQRR